jgi:hypothetical protein
MALKKRKDIMGEVLRLDIQEGKPVLFWTSWKSALTIDIQLREYWSPFRGQPGIRDHVVMHFTLGPSMETWYPDDFDLERRIALLWKEYYGQRKGELKGKKALSDI